MPRGLLFLLCASSTPLCTALGAGNHGRAYPRGPPLLPAAQTPARALLRAARIALPVRFRVSASTSLAARWAPRWPRLRVRARWAGRQCDSRLRLLRGLARGRSWRWRGRRSSFSCRAGARPHGLTIGGVQLACSSSGVRQAAAIASTAAAREPVRSTPQCRPRRHARDGLGLRAPARRRASVTTSLWPPTPIAREKVARDVPAAPAPPRTQSPPVAVPAPTIDKRKPAPLAKKPAPEQPQEVRPACGYCDHCPAHSGRAIQVPAPARTTQTALAAAAEGEVPIRVLAATSRSATPRMLHRP